MMPAVWMEVWMIRLDHGDDVVAGFSEPLVGVVTIPLGLSVLM